MSENVGQLERALRCANERVARAIEALAPKHKGGEMEEYESAVEDQLRLERELALATGQETAVAIDWQPQWDLGAPMPHVFSSDHRTFLIYLLSEADPTWDGTYANVINPTSDAVQPLAIVEFERCYSHRFGGPNDEVVEGHPLYGAGLVAYRAHEIQNSKWLAAERATNSVHSRFREESWKRMKHYLLFFHDECFECLVESYKIELARCRLLEAVNLVVGQAFES